MLFSDLKKAPNKPSSYKDYTVRSYLESRGNVHPDTIAKIESRIGSDVIDRNVGEFFKRFKPAEVEFYDYVPYPKGNLTINDIDQMT